MAEKTKYPALPIAATVDIGSETVKTSALPKGLRVMEDVGLAGVEALAGSVIYRAVKDLYEVRSTITPGGDYLVMFPAGSHYGSMVKKANTMLALRSSDKGKTWSDPYIAFKNIDINQHGFIALVPKGGKRIYSFGTQPIWGLFRNEPGLFENTPIGYFYSDDDGHNWTGPTIISPVNDPGYLGMAVMQMCETPKGTWLLSTYENNHVIQPQYVLQYILRSTDQGASWTLLPGRREGGWTEPTLRCLGEGRVIAVGDRVFMLCRTPMGRLYAMWSDDDGVTWSEPRPTSMIQPDAPPMLGLLSDGKTMVNLHHNRHHAKEYTGLFVHDNRVMGDRSEIWASLSTDCGETWSEPGFLFCNAVRHEEDKVPFVNNQCSYCDLLADDRMLHIFLPHRWQQALHLQIREEELYKLPKRADLLQEGCA